MKKIAVVALSLIAFSGAKALAQQPQKEPPIVIAASSFASTEVHINARPIGKSWFAEDAALTGPARIAIRYGQPHARGRKIEGGLIPADTVWRFGANEATTLHSDLDITLGALKLPRGDYTLFLKQGAAGWQLIMNRQTAQWGTDYDASKDLGRIPLVARTLTDNEESLTMYLVPESAKPESGYADLKGVLRIKWGRTELTTPWQVVR